jgi:predicted transcriptional regulator
MSQAEILEYLEKERRWVTSSEIQEVFKITHSNIARACAKLVKLNEIAKKPVLIPFKKELRPVYAFRVKRLYGRHM